ncbi:hypothetical protein [Rhizobium sp. ICMP 5592]|uniref:hypothetical protein n=1 Tax=Rhizobium sp. ICMP 5592 TaxID=2292445 RepID=UPI001297FE6C|nr:hypothetical protein [Rhizobium sp. ICMP 5592]
MEDVEQMLFRRKADTPDVKWQTATAAMADETLNLIPPQLLVSERPYGFWHLLWLAYENGGESTWSRLVAGHGRGPRPGPRAISL